MQIDTTNELQVEKKNCSELTNLCRVIFSSDENQGDVVFKGRSNKKQETLHFKKSQAKKMKLSTDEALHLSKTNSGKYVFSMFIGTILIEKTIFLVFAENVQKIVSSDHSIILYEIKTVMVISEHSLEIDMEISGNFTHLMKSNFFFSDDFDLSNGIVNKNIQVPNFIFMANYKMMNHIVGQISTNLVVSIVYGSFIQIPVKSIESKIEGNLLFFVRKSIFDLLQVSSKQKLSFNLFYVNKFQKVDFIYFEMDKKLSISIDFVNAPNQESINQFQISRFWEFVENVYKHWPVFVFKRKENQFKNFEKYSLEFLSSKKFPSLIFKFFEFEKSIDFFTIFEKVLVEIENDKPNQSFGFCIITQDIENFIINFIPNIASNFVFFAKNRFLKSENKMNLTNHDQFEAKREQMSNNRTFELSQIPSKIFSEDFYKQKFPFLQPNCILNQKCQLKYSKEDLSSIQEQVKLHMVSTNTKPSLIEKMHHYFVKIDELAQLDTISDLMMWPEAVKDIKLAENYRQWKNLTLDCFGFLEKMHYDLLYSKELHKTHEQQLNLAVVSFNVSGFVPSSENFHQVNILFNESVINADIIVLNFQEVILMKLSSLKSIIWEQNESGVIKSWESLLETHFCNFEIIFHKQLCGLLSFILVRKSVKWKVDFEIVEEEILRLGDFYFANKGCLYFKLRIQEQRFGFLNCHLTSGIYEKHFLKRNQCLQMIFEMLESRIADTEVMFFSGDFNYRVQSSNIEAQSFLDQMSLFNQQITNLSSKQENHDFSTENLKKLFSEKNDFFESYLQKDEFFVAQKLNPDFRKLISPKVTFMPTYRFFTNKNEYDFANGKRIPSWTDKILLWERIGGKFKEEEFKMDENTKVSDHRPIYLLGILKIDCLSTQEIFTHLKLAKH